MLRDKLRDKAYFDDAVDFSMETIEEYIDDLKTDENLSIDSRMRFAHGLVDYVVSLMHERYSRGDSILEIKTHLEDVLEYRHWQKKYADELPAKEQKDRIQWEELHEDDVRRTIIWLAFAYCLDMGQDYYQQVFELIENQGVDGILDNVAVTMGDANREIAQSSPFIKRFGKLYDVIQASPAERPQKVQAYLNAWYKAEGSPDYHLMDTDAYIGYWCWGAALVTKLYDIDDSSYIDHEYYPKDLVHWKRLAK